MQGPQAAQLKLLPSTLKHSNHTSLFNCYVHHCLCLPCTLTKRLPPNSKSHTHTTTHWQEQVDTCYTVTHLQALVSIAQGKTHCRTSSRKRGLTWAMLSGQPKGGWLARIASCPAQIAAKHVDAFQPQAIVQLSRSSLSMPTLYS